MTKTQKIWLWISLAIFVVPEALWSPVSNMVNDLLQKSNNVQILRPNFLTNSDNTNLLVFFLGFQFIGVVASLILLMKSKTNISTWLKIFIIITLSLIAIVTGIVFYIAFSLRHGINF